MQFAGLHYFPIGWPFLLAFLLLLGLIFALIELKVLRFAYERMGVPPRYVLFILLLTLLGGSVDIPIAEIPLNPPHASVTTHAPRAHGVRRVAPAAHVQMTAILAVNVGGALIPVLLSIYLTLKNRLFLPGLLAVAAVAVVTHWMARPVRGEGITLSLFIPFVTAAVSAMLLSWRRAAPLAYVAGCIGTLIGADLTNLDKLRQIGSPMVSIGGAGTFDGVFLVGLVAVLLAALAQPRPHAYTGLLKRR